MALFTKEKNQLNGSAQNAVTYIKEQNRQKNALHASIQESTMNQHACALKMIASAVIHKEVVK